MTREVTITGRVVRGTGYGANLGFPTANLDRRQYARLPKRPPLGIYAGTAKRQGAKRIYQAAIVIGPKGKHGLPKIEAYLLGFTDVLYGKKLELSLKKYLRRFVSFKNENVLKRQILKDIEEVRRTVPLTEV